MKDYLKRWNELAGTNNKTRINEISDQNIYGNEFLKDLINEDLGKELKAAQEEGGAEDDDIGDSEKSTLSDSALAKGLKDKAAEIAKSIPAAQNDEFAEIMNSVKDIAADKIKLQKVIKFIEKLK